MNVDNLKFLTHQHTVVHSVISCLISVERQINLSDCCEFYCSKAFYHETIFFLNSFTIFSFCYFIAYMLRCMSNFK